MTSYTTYAAYLEAGAQQRIKEAKQRFDQMINADPSPQCIRRESELYADQVEIARLIAKPAEVFLDYVSGLDDSKWKELQSLCSRNREFNEYMQGARFAASLKLSKQTRM